MGQPHRPRGPFHLPLSHGPPPSHPSFPCWEVKRALGSKAPRLPDFPGVKALKGEAQGGRSPWGSGVLAACRRKEPGLCGWAALWGTWAAANQRSRLWGHVPGLASRKWLTSPPGLLQPRPQATTWKCGTCKTSPSHTPGGILGTASCRLETGESCHPGPSLPRRARTGDRDTSPGGGGQIRGTAGPWGLPVCRSRGGISRKQERGPWRVGRGQSIVKSPHECLIKGEISQPLKGVATLLDSPLVLTRH